MDDNKASAAIAAVLGEAVLGRGGGVGVGELRMECSGILLLLLLYLVGIGIIAECRKVASTRGWNCHLNEHFFVWSIIRSRIGSKVLSCVLQFYFVAFTFRGR